MSVVALNRRFVEWEEKEPPDPEMRRALGLGEEGVGWDELLLKRRVVILAEAGSGKSTEIAERARMNAASRRYAFHAAVEDVGLDGLERALGVGGHAGLKAWRASTEDAWFFIDSVDEAKSSGVRLERVVRKIADGIRGDEERAHVILTGRLTDWEFRKDLESFKKWLPTPVRDSEPRTTAEEELLRVIRQEGHRDEKPPSSEQPFIALMSPLDRNRVRLFAEAKGAPNLEQFLGQLDAADLWHFARRPLDLDWLVRFWWTERRLGSLAEMVERSVSERLKETNTGRARSDTLDSTRALHAAERIGAAMVFGRRATIAIPDGEIAFTSDSPLDLADVLPDWSSDDRTLLLSRPIFDPATLGRARFHNDNEGVVRGYLAARWLARLRNQNLSTGALFDLLFAKSYGLDVVKPSLSETAAWLALWDQEVAREVVRRDASLLLLKGDPATLSSDVRRDALVCLVKGMTADDRQLAWWDNDKLRRFAQPDLGPAVLSLWPDHRDRERAAQLLLRIVWLGHLKDCAKLAYEAAFSGDLDATTRIFAGRALLAIGDEQAKRDYAALIIGGRSTLPKQMARDAMMNLVPTFINVHEVLTILESIGVANDHGGLGFAWEGPRLAERLNSPSELEELLKGLLMQVGGELGERAHHPPTEREKAYFPAIAAATLRLLKAFPPEKAPEVAIDATLRIGNRQSQAREPQSTLDAVRAELRRTSSRRRCAFWRAAERIRRPSEDRQRVENLWQMEYFGYPAGLQVEDLEWLLGEGVSRSEDDRRLAINSAFAIYQEAGSPVGLLERIKLAASSDPVAYEVYESWVQPRPAVGLSEAELALKEIESQNVAERARIDQSWIDFIREVRADPVRIAKLKASSPPSLNRELYQLWRLLDGATRRSGWAIESIAPLERIAGTEVAQAVRDGLNDHWRNWAPLLRSQQQSDERNTVRSTTLMGIAGISLRAASSDRWAKDLSAHEATLAAGYATLELNGFPRWLTAFAKARPTEVLAVLIGEIRYELSSQELTHCDTLSSVAYSEDGIARLVAPTLLEDLEKSPVLRSGVLSQLLHIIVRGLQPGQTPQFIRFGTERFQKESDSAIATQYLAAVFALDAATASNALVAKLALLNGDEQAQMVDRFLSATSSDTMSGAAFKPNDVPAETLEQLMHLTFQTNGPSAARKRPEGTVYQVDENDHADRARSAIFSRFVKIPGPATYRALLRLQKDPACPVPPVRLREIGEDRAIQDSESAPWPPSEAMAFKQTHETAPSTPRDLQCAVLRRLEDMQHDLLRGDFAQGQTLKLLPHEVDVQKWVADRLRLKQGRSYSVEREPHVVDEKEPDVRVRAKASDACVAMEIKVAESWTLKELEDALEVQLCGRYLRANDGRHGVLLLAHQKAREKGWEDTSTGGYLSFAEVVARLSARAAAIAGTDHDSPRAEVAVLDASSC